MTATKRTLLALLVLLNNALIAGALVAIPDDACAGGGCVNVEYCLADNCNAFTLQQLDDLCNQLTPPISGCCNIGHRCNDNGDCDPGEGDLLCVNRRPCP